jgi:alpha-mannosidase
MQVNVEKLKRRVQELARRRYMAARPIGPLSVARLDGRGDRRVNRGERWGERDGLYRMRAEVAVPAEWRGGMLALHLDLSAPVGGGQLATAEALLSIDGVPLHAIDRYHREVILPPALAAKDRFAIDLRVWNGIDEDHHTMHALELRRMHAGVDRLHQMMRVWLEATEHLPAHNTARHALLDALDAATLALDFTTDDAFYTSCDAALAVLTARLDALHGDPSDPWQPHVTATGHAHIDVAWLWRLRHTRLKAADTFATALYHMDRYPYFIFTASTPQLYQFVKEDQPALYARIKEKIAAGQWEAEGAMWLEADTNITGGESLVRQFIYGKRFFQEEFGVDAKVLWLPDVFGYSAALPQLIKGAEAEYFITTKISWNDTNRFPVDTFWWEGIDGTRVLSHFITAQNANSDSFYTYNAEAWPGVMVRSWRNYRQQEVNRELLVAYGWGDGGGGPTREMVEAAGMQALPISRDIPTASPGKVRDYMDRLAARVGDDPRLPVWTGELYFEYHRGTYTSQARTKRANRLAERDLHNAEFLATLAQHLAGQSYPKAALDDAWRTVLTHQFHDILPGSSIGPVYADAAENYARVRATTDSVINGSLSALAAAVAAPAGSLLAVNPLSWPRADLVELPAAQAAALAVPTQPLPDGRALALLADVPALGVRVLAPPPGPLPSFAGEGETDGVRDRMDQRDQPGIRSPLANTNRVGETDRAGDRMDQRDQPRMRSPLANTNRVGETDRAGDRMDQRDQPRMRSPLSISDGEGLGVGPFLMESPFYRLELNERGQITRLYDKQYGREVLAAGERANVFQLFEDKPNNFDAWDIDAFYSQKMWELDGLVERAVIELGPLRGGLRLVWRYLDRTTITQTIALYTASRRIDFVTEVDWHEHQTLLKVAFPVAIHNTHATAEIQFGNIRRPTHRNTSWERAQFEACGHKWIDLSEGDYGVALLNDCKYGYDVRENVMRQTLLKGAIYPDPNADQGRHQFTYSLLPHAGDWFTGNVHRAAYELNFPLLHAARPHPQPLPIEDGEGRSRPTGSAAINASSRHGDHPLSIPDGEGAGGWGWSLATIDAPNVIIETVKRAELSDDLVLRVYECANRRGPVTVTLPFAAAAVTATNLLEAAPQPVPLATDGRSFTTTVTPYAIKTFVIRRADGSS